MSEIEFREECLREHNLCRLLHGVDALKISAVLNCSAQKWAEHLVSMHKLKTSPEANNGKVGENIASRVSSVENVTVSGTEIAKQWYGDITKYDFSTHCGKASNFTQMIWKSSEEVGFGLAHTKGKCVAVAHYSPPGNVKNHYATNVFPLVGEKSHHEIKVDISGGCQYIKECGLENVCEENWTDELCVYKTPSIHIRTDSMSSDDNFELGLNIFNNYQRAQKRRLRKFIREAISSINKYRAHHGAPKLKHNRDLDLLSQSWAEELTKKPALCNSNNRYRDTKVGENVASRSSTAKCDYTGHELAEHWYTELSKYNFDQEPSNVQGIGNFTQMVWKSTTDIGIGKAIITNGKHCKVFVVCNFYPAGNVLRRFQENVLPAIQ